MQLLMTLPDGPAAYALADRLDREGIPVRVTTESGVAGLYTGVREAKIWVGDDVDIEQVRSIAVEFESRRRSRRCGYCGYDLRGHEGRATCPECAAETMLPETDTDDSAAASRTCPKCGETGPASFEVCWSCGSPIE